MYSVIKQENNRVKLGKNTFKMFVNKNAILSREWARVIVRIRCDSGVSRFQKLADARIAFVNNRRLVEINDMVMRPRMICNSGPFGRCFYIPYVFPCRE